MLHNEEEVIRTNLCITKLHHESGLPLGSCS
jgi:hypothetical protein